MMSDGGKPSIWEKVKTYSGPFWFLRGVAGTLALMGILAPRLGMEDWEFARAIHAVIVSWNQLMAELGNFLASVLRVPDVSASVVNAAIVFTSLVVPGMIAHYRVEVLSGAKNPLELPTVLGLVLSLVVLTLLFDHSQGLVFSVLRVFFVAMLCFFAWLTAIFLPSFKQALFWTVSALVAVEVAYWLPFVGDYVAAFADQTLGEDRPTD